MAIPSKIHVMQIFVEGRNDVMAIGTLLKEYGYEWPQAEWHPYIKDCESVEKLLETLPVGFKSPTTTRLGVVLDADTDLCSRWQQIRNRLLELDIDCPEHPDPSGTVIEVKNRKITKFGVWLMPNNTDPGMLEDFLYSLVAVEDSELLTFASEKTTEAIKYKNASLKKTHHSKGTMHSFLAWQEDPGLPFGTAITAKILKMDAPIAEQFIEWIKRLFMDD